MSMHSDFYYIEEIIDAVVAVLTSAIPSSALGIASYVLTSLALYTLASRRGIRKAWLSWVPVLNVWILGSLSDQYRYVVKGQYKSKRKSLLILNLLVVPIAIAMGVVAIGLVADVYQGMMYGANEQALLQMVMGPVIAEIALALPLVGIAIASCVIYFMALYDVYVSMDPGNAVLFLVLSILFRVTEPFFLFFSRNKDLGMPPQKTGAPVGLSGAGL